MKCSRQASYTLENKEGHQFYYLTGAKPSNTDKISYVIMKNEPNRWGFGSAAINPATALQGIGTGSIKNHLMTIVTSTSNNYMVTPDDYSGSNTVTITY